MSQNSIRAIPGFASKWVPFTIAVVSFVVSMYTLFVTSRQPVVEVVLPQYLRVSLNQNSPTPYGIVFLQPTLLHAGPSQQVEVIQSMSLTLRPPDAPANRSHTITWGEIGRFAQDPGSPGINYIWQGDPAPLLLTRETAQSPLAVFYGDNTLKWTSGEWRAQLNAARAGDKPDLTRTFTFTLTDELVERLEAGQGAYVYANIQPAD